MKTKVMKVEILIIDHDGIGEQEIKEVLENAKYPNRCIGPEVKSIEIAEVDWHEWHPLNVIKTRDDTYNELFNKQTKGV